MDKAEILGVCEWEGVLDAVVNHLTYKEFADAGAPSRVLEAVTKVKAIQFELDTIDQWLDED